MCRPRAARRGRWRVRKMQIPTIALVLGKGVFITCTAGAGLAACSSSSSPSGEPSPGVDSGTGTGRELWTASRTTTDGGGQTDTGTSPDSATRGRRHGSRVRQPAGTVRPEGRRRRLLPLQQRLLDRRRQGRLLRERRAGLLPLPQLGRRHLDMPADGHLRDGVPGLVPVAVRRRRRLRRQRGRRGVLPRVRSL